MLVLLLLSAMLLASSQATNFTQCDGGNTAIESVDISGCEGPGTCSVKYGDWVDITVTFTPTSNANNIYAGMGVFVYKTFRYPGNLNPDDACEGGVTCPITAGQTYTYTGKFEVAINSEKEVRGYFSLAKVPEDEEETVEELGCVVIPFKTIQNKTA